MHNRNRKIVAAIANSAIRADVEAYVAGKSPLNSRQTRVSHDFDPGFRVDQDDYGSRDIAFDAYYQEYLRPIGLGWHANARLQMENADEVAIGFKREIDRGPYEVEDKRVLDLLLPHLRVTARIAEIRLRCRGARRSAQRCADAAGPWSSSTPGAVCDACMARSRLGPLRVRAGRLCIHEGAAQRKLEALIARAACPPGVNCAILLYDAAGDRHIFQLVPLRGRARDIFPATCVLGVLIGHPTRDGAHFDPDLAIALFALTAREAQVVGMLCKGKSLREIAAELQIVPDTVRYHLKSIFEKTGATRQLDVVALFTQLAI